MNAFVRLAGGSCLAVLMGAGAANAVTISLSCGAVGAELQVCREAAEAWSEQSGHSVQIVSTPNSSSDRLALYQQILAAQGTDIDIFQVDVVWPGILGQHFIDLNPALGEAAKAHFPSIVENNTVDGELKAMPWFTDAGILYYRTDLLEKYNLEVPTTWAEVEEAARTVMDGERQAGNNGMWGIVFQARAYEGLTCNGLEWIHSFGGGTIVDAEGEITVDNPQAAEALATAAGWINTIAPEGVLNYTEEEARGVFQSGNSVFMRNWPYAWALAQGEDSPIRGNVGVAALPRGGEEGQPTGTLGGWQLAVSRYSPNAEIAIDLVRYLTSPEEQKRRALVRANLPTIPSLYEDPEILEANPFFGELYDTFTNAVARPSNVTGENYNRVSAAFWEAVHNVLTGRAEAEEALSSLASDLNRLKRRGW
jgi:trehalose/maltose transport system substrate-binding protein